jgi:hypothetical protein
LWVRRLKRKARHVGDEEDDRDLEREPPLERGAAGRGQARAVDRGLGASVKDRRHHEPDRREREKRGSDGGGGAVEGLALPLQPAGQDRRAQDEEHVSDDRSGERRLHDVVEPPVEGHERDDELGGVSEGRVHEPADAGPEPRRELFGRLPHDAGERNDRRAGESEHEERIPREPVRDDRERDEAEEELERVLGREECSGAGPRTVAWSAGSHDGAHDTP